ncbi:hypothetical protein ARGLB_032_00670 [Arthrobacter globiformis NBRC 12137]|uniref:Uncharacterized protein n=1 Tax=Arthrobacter globiformis (strain ATCC 8010 / DSM 20124 / JCM 1332 / NBRC 12137 / NCIMB 8907 / NRRL B-2979 / 168) TaxID=1077972 RepID=H0QJL9_ARTG1|nr:hypothetical protein [Arthrobacter globiformis]GAB13020.1 hypothetical protein ARGLB_032_00670 [Arthrobacter globiformis NBRC 12137]
MDPRGPLRLFRAALVTSLAVSLAVAGHVLGGGQLPDTVTLAVTAALLLAPAAWLARRQLSFAALFGVLGAGQVTLHASFTVFSPDASCLPQVPLAQLPPAHYGHAGLHCTAAMESIPMDAGASSPAMLAGHLLAMLATAWLLRRGEEALWQLLAWLRPLARLPRLTGFTPASHRPAAGPVVFVAAHRRNLRHDSLRGPPLAALPRTIH